MRPPFGSALSTGHQTFPQNSLKWDWISSDSNIQWSLVNIHRSIVKRSIHSGPFSNTFSMGPKNNFRTLIHEIHLTSTTRHLFRTHPSRPESTRESTRVDPRPVGPYGGPLEQCAALDATASTRAPRLRRSASNCLDRAAVGRRCGVGGQEIWINRAWGSTCEQTTGNSSKKPFEVRNPLSVFTSDPITV